MKIHQIFTDNALRNFNYIIEFSSDKVLIIDPWEGQDLLNLIKGKKLLAIINTHEHSDHTRGNAFLKKETGCEVWAHENANGKITEVDRFLKAKEIIPLEQGWEIEVADTPGHTMAHLCFILKQESKPYAIFTGDTLFNAGVGNCHNGGDPEVLFETISNIFQKLPDEVIVFPGHEYFNNNLHFTLDREPQNEKAKEMLGFIKSINWKSGPFQNTIGGEKQINTFMRLDNKDIKAKLSLSNALSKEVFLKLRELRNNW
ncbi:MAG: hydroxyacylglutathione hydrolase [Bacteriovoracaceae bacterium]